MSLGSLIGAGASLVGGLMGKSSAEEHRESQERIAAQNIALQREFAQSGIQWKVKDAEAAGVNPLYALGASTTSFSPVSVGGGPDMSMPNAVSRMGQDIGRAVDATTTPSGKVDAYTQQRQNLQLENGFLQNQLLSAQIAKLRQTPSAPGNPATNKSSDEIPGQGQFLDAPLRGTMIPVTEDKPSHHIETKSMERQAANPNRPNAEAGLVTDIGHTRTATGYMPVRSKDAVDRLDDDMIGNFSWNLRNRIAPTFQYNREPPNIQLPNDQYWKYHPFYQEYRIYERGTGRHIPPR